MTNNSVNSEYLDLINIDNPLGQVPGFFGTQLESDSPQDSDKYRASGNFDKELIEIMYQFCFIHEDINRSVIFANNHVRLIERIMGMDANEQWTYIRPAGSIYNVNPSSDVYIGKNDIINSAIRTGHKEMNTIDVNEGGLYEINNGVRATTAEASTSSMNFISNPAIPTGHLYTMEDIETIINDLDVNSFFIVDETYLPFKGADWASYSIMTFMKNDSLKTTIRTKNIHLVVICEWTKFFSSNIVSASSAVFYSTGLLSNITLTNHNYHLSGRVRNYLKHGFNHPEYSTRTWMLLENWRLLQIAQLQQIVPNWTFSGCEYSPWIWIKTSGTSIRDRVRDKLMTNGILVQKGEYWDDADNVCIIIKVMDGVNLKLFYNTITQCTATTTQGTQFTNFRSLLKRIFINAGHINVQRDLLVSYKHFSISSYSRYKDLYSGDTDGYYDIGTGLLRVKRTADPAEKCVTPIIVSQMYRGKKLMYFIIDGHSRFASMKEVWADPNVLIPIILVDYMDPLIFANTEENLPYTSHNLNDRNIDEKNRIINIIASDNILPTTNNSHHISCAGTLFPIQMLTTVFTDI